MDLVEGIGKDASGIRFAKEEFGIEGVQSTKTHILKMAKHEKLITVHRLFVTDFQSLQSGLNLAKISNPDFLELTPAFCRESSKWSNRSRRFRSFPAVLFQQPKMSVR